MRSLICSQRVLVQSPVLRQNPSPQCGFPVVFEVFTEQGAYLGGDCTNQTHWKRIQATSKEPTVIRPARGGGVSAPVLALLGLVVAIVAASLVVVTVAVATGDSEELGRVLPGRFGRRR